MSWVGVILYVPVGRVREEISIPGALLHFLCLVCAPFLHVNLLPHPFLSWLISLALFVVHHRWVRFKIRSVVPRVQQLIGVYSETSKHIAGGNSEQARPPSEGLTSNSGGIEVWEIMNEPLVWHYWNSTLVELHAASEHSCDRPG